MKSPTRLDQYAPISPVIDATRSYVHTVLVGDGRKPHCPFVPTIDAAQGYHFIECADAPENIDLDALIPPLRDTFGRMTPIIRGTIDTTILIIIFSHPEAQNYTFCSQMRAKRNQHRAHFLAAKQMIADMHPFHPTDSSNVLSDKPATSAYQAGLPLLFVRRMHAADHVFMQTAAEIEAYLEHFPDCLGLFNKEGEKLKNNGSKHNLLQETLGSLTDRHEEYLMRILLGLSQATQKWLQARRLRPSHPEIQKLFAKHFEEEASHDQDLAQELKERFGSSIVLTTPELAAIYAEIIEIMTNANDREKLVISISTLETAAALFYQVAQAKLRQASKHVNQHNHDDQDHAQLAIPFLARMNKAECINDVLSQRKGWDIAKRLFTAIENALKVTC